MKMYKGQFCEIEEVEVERVTNKFVVFKNGNRDSKDADWRWYRESREELISCMINNSLNIIIKCENSLEHERKRFEKIKAL